MFDLPSAKRVKRSELFDSTNSEDETNRRNSAHKAESPETSTAALNYSFEYELVNHNTDLELSQPQPQPAATEDAEVFAFNLFRPKHTTKPTTVPVETELQKDTPEPPPPPRGNLISIRSPSPPAADGSAGSFSRIRPDSDYFTSALPEAVRREMSARYAASAISAWNVLALSRSPWPGASLSWRVIDLPAHKRQVVVHAVRSDVSREQSSVSGMKKHGGGDADVDADADASQSQCVISRRRPRPSKKRRLLLSARSRHRQMLMDETKTKEEHERGKKNQKNRERKMKRRAKERREKAEKADGKEAGVDS